MITRVGKYLILIISIAVISACKGEVKDRREKRQTLNIKEANVDIKHSTGIDLLSYKSKIDQRFPVDSFYVKVCEDLLFNTGESQIHDEFGSKVTYDTGDSILPSHRDSLFKMMYNGIGNNIYLKDCELETSDTSYCQFKKQAVANLLSVNGTFTITAINTIGDVYEQYKKGYLNYEELSYMIVMHHVLRDICYLEE